ncbi:MAG: hypothetical protein H3C63_00465 [Candidatus Omnitrophica bacterium]|nr:hypothetical protein [Candidatus Omnitrophota bacterium]
MKEAALGLVMTLQNANSILHPQRIPPHRVVQELVQTLSELLKAFGFQEPGKPIFCGQELHQRIDPSR